MWLDMTMLAISALALVVGIVGCFVPVIPGPLVAYCGLLCMIPTEKSPSVTVLAAFGILTVVVTVLDYVVPALGAKKFDCSKWGVWGCAAGTVVGLFFFPLGLLLGPFLGALAGELLIARKTLAMSIKGGIGALLGFLAGLFLKVAACLTMLACYVMRL